MEWLDVVELIMIPALSGLLWLIFRIKTDLEERIVRLNKELGDAKVEMAKNYVAKERLKEVEDRITEHLIRIENTVLRLVETIGHGR